MEKIHLIALPEPGENPLFIFYGHIPDLDIQAQGLIWFDSEDGFAGHIEGISQIMPWNDAFATLKERARANGGVVTMNLSDEYIVFIRELMSKAAQQAGEATTMPAQGSGLLM